MQGLRDFLTQLPSEQILRVPEPVDRDFVPTALVMELQRRKRFPVVWLQDIAQHDIPVVTNLFATRERLSLAAGGEQGDDVRPLWLRSEASPVPPRIVDDGPVREVIALGSEVDVTALPISRHFAGDAGRYVSSGILVSRDPRTQIRNLSFQRMQVKGPDRCGISLHSRGHIWDFLGQVRAAGRNLEVAVVIGAHPAVYLAAAAKVAMDLDEIDLAGGLLREPVDLVKCETVDLEVPAQAEIVLEGEILADVEEDEGPFAEYHGYSSGRSTRNVLHIKAITRRAQPIYLDIIPGNAREHLLLAQCANEAHVLQRLREVVPQIVDLRYPMSGTPFHAYVSIKPTAAGQARHALLLLFGLDSYVKCAIAVDPDIDLDNDEEVMWALATRTQADEDVFVVPRVFGNRLDPTARDGMSAKMGVDATRGATAETAPRISLPEPVLIEARAYLDEHGTW